MTDVLERRFQAVANSHDDSSWGEVRRRAGRSRSSRPALLAVAVVAVVAVAAPAFGLHEPLVDFVAGDPAPDRVREDFALFDLGAPAGMASGVIPGETRRILTVRLSDGPHTLWVAPTRAGGYCTYWSGMSAGCDRLGTVPLGATWGGEPYVITGHADADYVDSVEFRFSDRTVERADVTWVGPPIDAGFFAYEPRSGRMPERIVGLDGRGNVVAVHPFEARTIEDLLSDAVVEDRELLLAVETGRGVARVWTAPTRYEGRCAWVEYLGQRLPAARCAPVGYGWEGVALRAVSIGGDSFVIGTAGPRFAPLELRLSGNRRSTLHPVDDIVFAKLPDDVRAGDTVTVVPADAGEEPRRHGTFAVERVDD